MISCLLEHIMMTGGYFVHKCPKEYFTTEIYSNILKIPADMMVLTGF